MRALLICLLLVTHNFAFTAVSQVYFSPKDELSERLISLINEETESVYAAVYCFTHQGIAKALMDAKKRGVKVEVIVDPFSIKARTPIAKLDKAGVPVFVWSPPEVKDNQGKVYRTPLMHDKFCIFGGKKVWTGSFNFTYEATRSNAENAIVFDDAKIVNSFIENFKTLKERGCVAYGDYMTLKIAQTQSSKK